MEKINEQEKKGTPFQNLVKKNSIKFTLAEFISKALKKALKIDLKIEDIHIEYPQEEKFGDYSTNVAMLLAKKNGKNPRELASKLISELNKDKGFLEIFQKCETAGPGFINFSINSNMLVKNLGNILNLKDKYGSNDTLKSKRISFEYAHPNPFKAFHIGHLRNIILGESLIRIIENFDAEVIRVNYQGDVGMHIAKSIWGILELEKKDGITMSSLKDKPNKLKAEFLGKAYAVGASAYKDSLSAKNEIHSINALVYCAAQEIQEKKYHIKLQTDYKKLIPKDNPYELAQIKNIWLTGRQWSLDYFKTNIYERLGSHFKREYMESETMKLAEENISKALKKGILIKSQGAIIFDGSKYGLDTRVFANSKGLPTYEGKELGLAPMEFTDNGKIDLNIHNVAVEQISFFKVTFKVKELLDPEIYKGKMYHNPYEFVGLKKGKMSSRLGNVVLAEDILNEASEKIKIVISEKKSTLSQTEIKEIAETVGVAAIKYSFLNINAFKYLAFDFEKSLNFEGDSGPYLQYTYTRANSIITQANSKQLAANSWMLKADSWKLNHEEAAVMKSLVKFPEIVFEAGKQLSPNLICNYLFDLAQKFNLFYKKNKVLTAPEEEKNLRLTITACTAQVIKKGLYLLGINTLEKM